MSSPETAVSSKPVTIQDIADTLGIHKSTVSNALAGKGRLAETTRARIITLAEELGYEPDPLAQRLAARNKSKVVCLCTGSLDPGRGTEKVAFIQGALTGMGLEVPIYAPAKLAGQQIEEQSTLLRQLRRQQPLAIVCSVHSFSQTALEELVPYLNAGGHVVTFDIPVSLKCDQVIFDRIDNAYQGAKYLLDRGHRRVGIGFSRMQAAARQNPNSTQNLRLRGFVNALTDHGVAVNPDYIFENSTYEVGGAEMAHRFLELKERPTALVIVNDYVALAFMVEVMKAGVRIPEDVSIIGQDDLPIAAFCPVPLTSISQSTEDIVQAVVGILQARLAGDTEPYQCVTVRGKLVERASVAPVTRGASYV
jgi:DNA-binding LacI/PurR family transcriptional regulator